MVVGEISEVVSDRSSVRPVLVNFQNGDLVEGGERKLSPKLCRDPNGAIVPLIATEKILYAGSVNRDDDGDGFYNFLAVRNSTTNKVRLLALDMDTLKAITKKSENKASTVEAVTDNRLSRRSDLDKQFGSKRTKRKTEIQERMRTNIDAVKDDLEKTIANAELDSTFLNTTEDALTSGNYLPPINRDATAVEDVYKIEEIVPESVLHSLKAKAKELLEAKSEAIQTCEYVKNEILKLQRSASSKKSRSLRLLLIVDCLIAMVGTNAKVISTKLYAPCPYSEALSKFLLDTFTLQTGKIRTRPLSYKDKSISYIVILSLLAGDDREANLDDIGKATKLGLKKLQEMCRALLLTFKLKDRKVVQLKLPLPAAPVRNVRAKK